MKAVLVCPGERPGVSALAKPYPLAAVPLLGMSLVEYWLSHLAGSGFKKVTVLAHDRPEYIEALVAGGTRWGLEAKVVPEARELTPAQVLLKYPSELEPAPSPQSVVVLDHFPGLPDRPLFLSYTGYLEALLAWMPRAILPDRVGVRQVSEGVWVGLGSRISPEATLRSPCWIGRHVLIDAGAMIGPNAIIEDGAFIEPGVEVTQSCIGPDTFAGRLLQITGSIAWGSTFIDCQAASAVTVPDPFILCAIRQARPRVISAWRSRLAAFYARNKDDAAPIWKHLLLNKEG